MNLVIVIAVNLQTKDLPGIRNIFHPFTKTPANQTILEPSVGSFNFSLSLRREGIRNANTQITCDLFPLRIGVISEKGMLFSQAIPSLNKPENGMAVHVIRMTHAINDCNVFQGKDMCPCCFSIEQIGIQNISAIVIKTGYEIPFCFSVRCKLVVGRIMLD